ncbi:cytochrome P450 [Microseira wollei]|uniref:Cytochrome P450 n=1 Tax=Microseira wollei NIES-4236 TaxID=2530354 RepID=A0AAV3XSX0_9CYAN|nr:cytochrome P450 [Microseira wollei]GET44249.1 cytochrome P450 [Microseira wollei NIES-4236]
MSMNQEVFNLPGPGRESVVDTLANLNEDKLAFLTKCSREYGDVVPLQVGINQVILLNCPSYIEQVSKDRSLFVRGPHVRTALQRLLGEGIFLKEGESWLHQRRITQQVFYHQHITTYGETIVAYTERLLNRWQDGEIRNVQSDMMRLTLDIIWKVIFNDELTEEEAQDIGYILGISTRLFESKDQEEFNDQQLATQNLRYERILEEMDRYIYSLIQQRRQSGEYSGDLLSMLMQVRDEDNNSQMSDKQLRDEVVTLLFAGQEALAVVLSWTFILLSLHPQVQTKLLTELKEVLDGRYPSVSDIPHLCYTNSVIKEAMRLYPPVAVMPRIAIQDYEIGGYKIPAGCTVLISAWTMHRHPRYFEDPDKFDPDRWANDLEKRLPRGVYLPFGNGPRICIGKSFAEMEMVLIIATMAQKYQLTLVPDFQIVLWATITLRSKLGVPVKLEKK